MSTTTIRLDNDLKERVAAAAERAGKTAHAFILDAIAQAVEKAELDNDFHQLADERWATLMSTGESVGLTEARAYLEARARGALYRFVSAIDTVLVLGVRSQRESGYKHD